MLNPTDHVLDHVDDYLHEILSLADATTVERHSESCRICKVALEEARKRQAALETVPACEAAEQLVQATLKRIDAHVDGRRRFNRYVGAGSFAVIAASVLILTSLHLYYANLKPSPYDLRILGQTTLLAGSTGAIRVQLVNRDSQAALADVPIDIELRDLRANQLIRLASFTTNAQGTGQPRFQLPDWADGEYQLVVTARPAREREVITQGVKLMRSWKLMLSSDKPVYQPEQEIHVRALALRNPDLKPVAGQNITFSITDPKGNVIFKRQDVTSKFGIGSIDCPLANEILEGPYAIQCKVGDTDSKLTVDVKKYVLPKFKIAVELDRPYYQPGQTVHGKIQADYFFGKPVADGTVDIEVQTTDIPSASGVRQPPSPANGGRQPPDDFKPIQVRTDATGKATFEFKLPDSLVGRPQQSGDARIAVQVTISDTAGQKQVKTESRTVTANPLRLEVIPEGGSLVRDLPNTVFLFASYADGRPAAKTRLSISGVDKELLTNDLGVASFEVTPDADEVAWTIKATDNEGHVGRHNARFTCGSPSQDFLVRTDRAVYNGGDTVRLVALGGGKDPVFVDLIKNGQTMLTEIIDVTNGRGEYRFDLPADLFGTVELCTYRFGADNLPVRKTRVLYIRQAKQLGIKAGLDHAEYRPGHQAKLQLTLTDDQGKPTPGALSLAAVDEAVFAVLDQAPGMEKTFYLLEQQLLKPIYAIYPWAPDLTTSIPPADRVQFEQALFARTWQGGNRPFTPVPAPAPPPSRGGFRPAPVPQPAPPRSPHTLFVTSFPTKDQLIRTAREVGLHRVEVAAWMLGSLVGVAIVVYGAVLIWMSPYGGLKLGFCALMGLFLIITAISALGTNANTTFTAVAGGVREDAPANRQFWRFATPAPKSAAAGQFADRLPEIIDSTANTLFLGQGIASTDAAPPRIREWFPETLLWRPEVITDDNGKASIQIDLADSITTWRLSASAVSADGRLGAAQSSIRVFQPFFVDLNLPVALTRGDEVAIPTVVYNYLDKPQTVDLTLEIHGLTSRRSPWFELLDDAGKKLELAPGEVRSTSYRLRVTKVGNHELQVTARGSGVADAIKRQIEVVPDGRRVEQVHNGTLQNPVNLTLTVPQDAIDGSAKAIVKIYPSSFSQLVEGLDAIFKLPYGCFEQTSSTTYPNILALDYLKQTKKSVPEVEAKARQYIHLGYQRLVGFEVSGGGFDWFGRPPANRRLTAYGLMEFEDMARVHDVDPALIGRTRDWLLKQRNQDGSWSEGQGLHQESDPARGQSGDMARFATTAYIGWAVFGNLPTDPRAQATLDYLLSFRPERIDDPYILALACNALGALDTSGKEVKPYLDRLEALKRTSEDGKRVWWEQAAGARTAFYGSGRSGNIEATALAALAMLKVNTHAGTVRGALTWITEQKDPSGTWHSTQATVLALKALLAGTGKSPGGDKERRIEIALGDGEKQEIVIPADQAEVMKQLDLSPLLRPGANRLTVTEKTATAAGYQVAFRYHVPGAAPSEKREPLAIDVAYDRTDLKVGDTVTATATIVNQMPQVAPMVILNLPIPAGFAIEIDDLAKLQSDGLLAKFQLTPRVAIIYLRGLEPGAPLKLVYRLRATMPVKVTVPPAQVYEYYDPDKKGQSPATRMTVGG